MNERVDSNSSMWRLRTLVAMGHSGARISRALGVSEDVVQAIIQGHRPTVAKTIYADVLFLWGCWWDKTPREETRAEKWAACLARNTARRNKWPTPLNLDEDEIETPGYRPFAPWRHATGLGIADDFPLGDGSVAS